MGCAVTAGELEDEFRSPPHPAKPWLYWINMDGHFTKAGITADLESMKAVGIGGMIHMDVDVGVHASRWFQGGKACRIADNRRWLESKVITKRKIELRDPNHHASPLPDA